MGPYKFEIPSTYAYANMLLEFDNYKHTQKKVEMGPNECKNSISIIQKYVTIHMYQKRPTKEGAV